MKKNLLNNVTYENVVKWWLTAILLFLPFQHLTVSYAELCSYELSVFIQRLDDITILIFLPLAIIELCKNREIFNWINLALIFSMSLFVFWGLISGIINGNSLFVTLYGTLDYIRNFFVIFIYAAFIKEFSEFKKIFRLLLMVAVFIGLLAIIQEIWAQISIYILKKNVLGTWRFGIYRVSSVMAHYNVFGIYSLLILTMYLSTVKKVNFSIFLFLFAGVFLSISRMIYAGFLFVIGLQIFRRRWAMLVVLIPILIIVCFMMFLPDLNILNFIEDRNESVYTSSGIPYRVYAREKALIVWMDHPMWGVGPGMFGGAIAKRYNTHVYEEYNFTFITQWFGSLDQFWPQILAEMGIMGSSTFFILLISLTAIFIVLWRQAGSNDLRNFFIGLTLFMLALFVYMFGSNLNINPVLFTFFAITGMGLGSKPST